MLRLEGAARRYGDQTALAPTDLTVPACATVVIIGPSGCGKSTLLGMMNGLVAPDAGRVFFDDEELTAANMLAARRRMGYVIQEGGLFPHMTAGENVTLMARVTGWAAPRIDESLQQLCELTQFPADALGRHPDTLSGGQRQRVSLMRALMLDPDVLLLDEPLGALDPLIRYELQDELRRIFRRLGKTVVMVTHDMAEAAFFADEIVLMADGRIIQRGTVADLTERPAEPFVSRFVRAQRTHWNGGP